MLVYIANDRQDKNFVFSTAKARDKFVASKDEPFILSCEEVDKHAKTDVTVWVRESVWRKRELTVAGTKESITEMLEGEFRDNIVNYVDVLDEESTGEESFDMGSMEFVDDND